MAGRPPLDTSDERDLRPLPVDEEPGTDLEPARIVAGILDDERAVDAVRASYHDRREETTSSAVA